MMPLKVHCTGLEIDPMIVLKPRRLSNSPIPADWIRFHFEVEKGTRLTVISKWISSWIHENSDDHWTMYSFVSNDKEMVVVAFANVSDAMMFKLKGEDAWKEMLI